MTPESYTAFAAQFKEFKSRAEHIVALDPEFKGSPYSSYLSFDTDETTFEISYTYNSSCNCHPEYTTDTLYYPIEMLFWSHEQIEEHYAKVNAERKAKEEKERAERKAKEAAELRQREQKEFERLSKLYGHKA